jgi:protein SCO1/2
MTRASDGARVTERDYRGQVVALFLGFTFCPDVCPMTLANLSEVARRLGPGAEGLSILFVTVDPGRDTLDILRRYAGAFHPRADALRGTENQIAMLARRYRVTYEVEPDGPDGRYTVTHGPSVYVFDASGEARLMLPRFETGDADIEGAVAELRRLLPARAA